MCGVIYTRGEQVGDGGNFPVGDTKALPLEIEINGYRYTRQV